MSLELAPVPRATGSEPPARGPACRAGLIGLLLAATLAIAACGGGGGDETTEPPPAPRTEARAPDSLKVTARGAILESADGARVEIPAGASLYPYEASISRNSEGAPALPPGVVPMGAMVALEPHGAVFTAPIRVSLPFDAAAVPAGATLRVARGEPGGRWQILPGVVEGNRISVATNGFSYYMPVVIFGGTYVFSTAQPFGEVTAPGQTAATARDPVALLPNGEPNPFVRQRDYRIYTQAELAAPLALRLRGALTAGSDVDLVCGQRPARLVVTATSVRVEPDPADPNRATLRSIDKLRAADDTPVELASLEMPRDGVTRELNFSVNLAHYAYPVNLDDSLGGFWGGLYAIFGIRPTLPGAAGLWLETHFTCSGSTWFSDYDRSPYTVLRRGFPDTLAFTAVPADLTVNEGDPASFTFTLAQAGNFVPGDPVAMVQKWQRSPAGFPDLWLDIDPWQSPRPEWDGWNLNSTYMRLSSTAVNRSQHDGTRYRVVVCMYQVGILEVTLLGPCLTSPAASLAVTQDIVAPQPLTSPVPQVTVRENATGQVTQFTATFSGVPRPTVRWETLAPGSPQWDPVDPATHSVSGDTLSTTRGFTLADRGRQYRAVASNAGGSTTSFASTLFVTTGLEPPAITAQPQDIGAAAGNAVLFTASVTGSAPMSYQWTFNGSPIPGANGPVLAVNNVNAANAGGYQLEASNRENSVRSRVARLTVAQAPQVVPAVAPPRILTQPASVTVTAGNTATFAVGATGSEPLRYQWFRNGQALDGAFASALTLGTVREADAGTYAVMVLNSAGRVRSADVTLTVRPAESGPVAPVAPTITTQPTGLAVNVGQAATLAVAASGSAPLTYQWQRNGVPISGATGPILTLATAKVDDAGQYSVLVRNAGGQVTSADAGLVVTPVPGAPTITAQPGSRSVLVGLATTFVIDVAGSPAPLCLWMRNGVAVSSAGPCRNLVLPAVTLADNGAVYTVVVYNAGGFVISTPAVLTVTDLAPPQITGQPADVSVSEGSSATFTVAASANGPLTYAWERLGVGSQVTDTGTLNVTGLALADSGAQFRVRVCNGAQTDNRCAVSRTATLTVLPALPASALTATQVVAGYEWSLALRPDRTVWGWGSLHSSDGTVVFGNTPTPARRPVRLYPAVLSDVRQVAGWYDGFWALKGEPGTAASRVLHWGNARSGNDGRGSDGAGSLGSVPTQRVNAAPVELLERRSVGGVLLAVPVDRVCSIAATSDRVLLIRALDDAGNATDCKAGSAKTVWVAGTLSGFSADSLGVVVPVQGLPRSTAQAGYSPPARVVAAQPTALTPGPTVVVLEDGRGFVWGPNLGNLFGLLPPASTGTLGGVSEPAALRPEWGSVLDGAFGYASLMLRTADGRVAVSGRNDSGELGRGPQPAGTVNNGPLPLLAADNVVLDGVQALAGTQAQVSLALRRGLLYAWGAGGNALQGGSPTRIDYPRLLPASGDSWQALSASHQHALAVAANGAVYAWGNGLRGALGNGVDGGSAAAPTLVAVP